MRARLHHNLPDDVRAWALDAGIEPHSDGRVLLMWFDGDPASAIPLADQIALGQPQGQGEDIQVEPIPVIALVAVPEHIDAAIQTGATDAIVGRPPGPELLARLSVHQRITRLWFRRMQEQRRQARRTMTDLKNTRDLLGRLIDATPNPVMAVDNRGRVLVFNRSAETALGYDAEYARTHMHVTDVYAEATDARRVLAELRATQNGMVQGLSVRLRARWGEQIPVELSAAEVHDTAGGLIATVGVFVDMREQVALKNRLEATTEQLIAAEQRAGAITMAGEAAYEINQPLTALMGTLELLAMQKDLSDRAKDRLDRAQGHLQRIRDAVRNLAQHAHSAPTEPGRERQPSRMAEITQHHD